MAKVAVAKAMATEGGLFTKKFELYFKGSAASAPIHSPRHLHCSAFGLTYFLRARFLLGFAEQFSNLSGNISSLLRRNNFLS